MHETRRNSNGRELGARLPMEPDYDGKLAGEVVELPDTLEGRVEVFLNRWHWRGPRDVVKRELNELIESAKHGTESEAGS